MRRSAAVLTVALGLMVTLVLPAHSETGSSIVFHSYDRGREGLWIRHGDGAITPVPNTSGASAGAYNGDNDPEWSPDGKLIAFWSAARESNAEIYTIAPDGTGLRRLTRNKIADAYPSWSPDSKNIVFSSNQRTRDMELYVMTSAGKITRRLTNSPGRNEENPVWSPVGGHIAYVQRWSAWNGQAWDHFSELWLSDELGANAERLTAGFLDHYPAWSPDGASLSFRRIVRDGTSELHRMNVATREVIQLTTNEKGVSSSAWSPDGQTIAFTTNNGLVGVSATDGSGRQQLTTGHDRDPSWRPASV